MTATVSTAEPCPDRTTGKLPVDLVARKRRESKIAIRWVALFAVALMLLEGVPQLAAAAAPADHRLQILSLTTANNTAYTTNFTTGQRVWFNGSFDGGNGGGNDTDLYNRGGYHLYWFFGQSNASGNLSVTQEWVADPSVCAGNFTTQCGARSTFSQSVVYSKPGTFNVSMELWDAWQDFIISFRTIQINVPEFNVTIAPPTPLKGAPAGSAAIFNATAYTPGMVVDNDAIYTWNLGNGQIEYGRQITYFFTTRGQYYLYVTARDEYTGWTARAYMSYNVSNQAPYWVYAHVPQVGVVWDPVNMTAVASDHDYFMVPYLQIWWNFSDGSYASSGNVPGSLWVSCGQGEAHSGGSSARCDQVQANMTHVFTQVGYYHVNITVADTNGIKVNYCPSTGCVIHIELPSVYVHPKNVYATVGQVALLNATKALLATPQGRNVSGSALENYSWNSSLGDTWGSIGRLSSGYVIPTSAPATPTIAIKNPYNTGWTKGSTNVTFNDTKPIVGVNKVYNLVNIHLWTPSNFTGLTGVYFNLSGNTVLTPEGFVYTYDIPGYQSEIFNDTYAQIALSPAHIPSSFTGYLNLTFGGSGGTTVSKSFTLGCARVCVGGVSIELDNEAYDQPVFLHGQAFSPGTSGLNTTVCTASTCLSSTTFSCPAPASGPALCYFGLVLTSFSGFNGLGAIYTEDQHGWYGYDNVTLTESSSSGVSVSGTAPQLTLNLTGLGAQPTVIAGAHPNFGLNDTYYGTDTQTATWNWGDESPTVCCSTGGQAHPYYYEGKYILYVEGKSGSGVESVNWTYVNVVAPPPTANFTVRAPSLTSGATIQFDGTNSSEGREGGAALAYTWQFSDGGGWSGNYSEASVVDQIFEAGKTYYVRLTVENPEGGNATVVKTVAISYLRLTIQVPKVLTTINLFAQEALNVTSGPLSAYPLLNVSWNYADGQLMSKDYGLDPGHAYVTLEAAPKHWWINVTATTIFGQVAHASTNWTTATTGVSVDIPELGDIVYGASQNGEFSVQTFGPRLDHTHPFSLTYTWIWGKGTPATSAVTTTSSFIQAYHAYNYTGPVTLIVTANNSGVLTQAELNFSTLRVSDGDGLPDEYDVSVLHVSPYAPLAGGAKYQTQGGCTAPTVCPLTNFMVRYLGAIGNLNQDLTGDGLTSMQAIMGSVTGYQSSPVDPNPSGDGIPQGSAFFTSSYPANQTGVFNSNIYNGLSGDPIPGVLGYSGNSLAFNQSRIVVDLNETLSGSAVTGDVTLNLELADGRNITLGTPAGAVATYYLLNASPTMGQFSSYGLSVSDFSASGTWTLWTSNVISGVVGSIPSATLFESYFTNPSVADPTKQGLLQGHGISTPIFNCSAPLNETFSVFNATTESITNVSFWPYTETYYKLSIMQGVPYTTSTNRQLFANNTNSTSGPAGCNRTGEFQNGGTAYYHGPRSSSLFPAVANYLGDADFGISPLDAYAAGDPGLTNGMKALGAAAYNWTRGQYLNVSAMWLMNVNAMSNSPYGPVHMGYAADEMGRYYGALNPTALSTAGDTTPDSQAINPVAPLALNVTINSANDPNCYIAGLDDALQIPNEEVSISQGLTYNWLGMEVPSGTTFYTGSIPPSHTSNSCDCVILCGGDLYGFQYGSSGTSYLLPLNSESGTWTVSFELWVGNALTPQSAVATETVTGSPWQTWTKWASQDGFNATVKVTSLPRAPTILVNTSSDVESLAGYGYRYSGEQQFYSFDLGMGASSNLPTNNTDAMFQSGVNVILESRAAYTNSTAGENGISTIDGLPGLSAATVTTQSGLGTNSSSSASLSTWAADLSASSTNAYSANRTLQMLLPRNATGAWVPLAQHGYGAYKGWIILNSTQVELLGLSPKALFLVPLTVPSWLATPSQSPPQSYLGNLAKDAATVGNDFVGALVALGNYIATVSAQLAAAVGQWVVGAFDAAASAVNAAVSAVQSAIDSLLSAILNFIRGLLAAVIDVVVSLTNGMSGCMDAALLAMQTTVTGGNFVTTSEVSTFWGCWSAVIPLAFAITAGLLIVINIVNGFTLGSSSVITLLGSVLIGAFVLGGGANYLLGSSGVPTVPLSSDPVRGIENVANFTTKVYPDNSSTTCSGCPSSLVQSTQYSVNYQWVVDLLDFGVAGGTIYSSDFATGLDALSHPSVWGGCWTDIFICGALMVGVDIALAVISCVLDAINTKWSEPLYEAIGLFVGVLALGLDAADIILASVFAESGLWEEFGTIDEGLAVASILSEAIALNLYTSNGG